jgi:hypothetical protein
VDAMVRHLVVVAVRPGPVRLKTCTTCNAQMRCVCDGTALEPTREVTVMLLQLRKAARVCSLRNRHRRVLLRVWRARGQRLTAAPRRAECRCRDR